MQLKICHPQIMISLYPPKENVTRLRVFVFLFMECHVEIMSNSKDIAFSQEDGQKKRLSELTNIDMQQPNFTFNRPRVPGWHILIFNHINI